MVDLPSMFWELAGAAGERQNVRGDYMEIANRIYQRYLSVDQYQFESEKVDVVRNKSTEWQCYNLCDMVIQQGTLFLNLLNPPLLFASLNLIF